MQSQGVVYHGRSPLSVDLIAGSGARCMPGDCGVKLSCERVPPLIDTMTFRRVVPHTLSIV